MMFRVRIDRYLDQADLQFVLRTEGEAAAIRDICNVYDSTISLVINHKDVLTGFEDVYDYPVFTFVKEMNNGVARMVTKGAAIVPIFLQQFAFRITDRHHDLALTLSAGNTVFVTFGWTASISRPVGLPLVVDEQVELSSIVDEVRRITSDFRLAVRTAWGTSLRSEFPRVEQKLFREFATF